MTPDALPGPVIAADSLLPRLLAIAPAVEPVRPLPPIRSRQRRRSHCATAA
jgi:hypothetical protein